MALSLRFFPLDGTAQRSSPKRCLAAESVSASCTGDKGMPVGKCMPAVSTIAAHCSHVAASARSVHTADANNVRLEIEMEVRAEIFYFGLM